MKQFYETDKFLKLRDEWYSLLKEEGFNDIEVLDQLTKQPCGMLRGMSPGDLRRGLYKSETEDYFRYARQQIWKMKAGPERVAWKMHSEGMSVDRIYDAMKNRYDVPKGTIRRWVRDGRNALLTKLREGKL